MAHGQHRHAAHATAPQPKSWAGSSADSSFTASDGFNNVNGDPVTHAVFSPPDNGFAASGASIVSAVNDTIGWYAPNLTGFQYEAFSQFFPSSLVGKLFFTDPRVLYDAQYHNYVVVEELYGNNSSQSKILIGVSKDAGTFAGAGSWSDPTHAGFNNDWNFFTLDATVKVAGKVTAIDFPEAALDGANLYISGDQFAGSKYAGNSYATVPLSVLEAHNTATRSSTTLTNHFAVTGDKVTMNAVTDGSLYDPHGGATSTTQSQGAFWIGYDGESGSPTESVSIAHLNSAGVMTAPMHVALTSPTTPHVDNFAVSTLVGTEVGGHSIDASDRRILDADLTGTNLFAVTEVASPNGGAPHLHWIELDVSQADAPKLVVQGDVLGDSISAGAATYNGSLAIDSSGYMIFNFTASGPQLNPADYYAVHKPTDGANGTPFWEAPVQFAHSNTSYSDGQQISRWGDYSSAVVDPTADPTQGQHKFLISNEYAIDAGHWGTASADILIA